MSLSRLAIRRPVFAWMVMAALVVFGGISFFRMGISQMPDVDFPVVNISLNLLGAAPEVMETQVVDVVEDAVMGIQGISNLTSTSRQGSASVTIEFDIDKNIDVAVQEVQARMAQVRSLLPVNLDPPAIMKTNPEDQPIGWVVLTADPSITRFEQMMYARNDLFDLFATVDGVADVMLGGYVDANMRVWVSNAQLLEYELTVGDVIKSIKANHQEVPAGRLEGAQKEFNVRLMGEARSAEDFSQLPITFRGGRANYRALPLSSVAKIEEGLGDVRRISRYLRKPAIGFGVIKQRGANSIAVAESLRKRLEEVRSKLRPGYQLEMRVDSTRFIRASVHELNFTLLMAAILTSIVCYFFLGSWSSTVNVLLAIPTSIVGTFIVLYFFGFTLNTFTLLGLSLAIGIVVDDAIMMLENITRHFRGGKARVRSAVEGAEEIAFAAVAATIAVVAIFLPVIFMKGLVGRYLYQYGITVTTAVLLSLLEALLLTPMRSSRMMTIEEHRPRMVRWVEPALERLTRSYSRYLNLALQKRWWVLGGSTLLFVASLGLFKLIPGEMVPAQDQSQFLLRVRAPVGSSLEFTNEKCKVIEEYLAKVPEIGGFYTAVGGFGGDTVNEANMFVTLVPPSERRARQDEVLNRVRDELTKLMNPPENPSEQANEAQAKAAVEKSVSRVEGGKAKKGGIQIFAQDLSLRGFSASRGYPVEFTVQGPDWAQLGKLTLELMEKLGKTGLVSDLNTDYQLNVPEVVVVPDRQKAAERGVSVATIAQTINSLMGGATMGAQTRYFKNGHRHDIRVRLVSGDREQKEDMRRIYVRNNRGEVISLADLTKIEDKGALQMISRRNRERAIGVFGNIAPGHHQEEVLKAVEALSKSDLPNGYHVRIAGGSKAFRESMQSFLFAFVLGILISYMILASQFNSFLHPISVLAALPFSVSGAALALYLGGQSINLFSLIGFILLMGIVKKNSILLVEFTNHLREQGREARAAILEACPVRLRPILMTSIATVAGALPGALSIGPGAESMKPMAIAIIGGVVASTLLTLFVVPCLYSVLARFERTTSRSEPSLRDVAGAGLA